MSNWLSDEKMEAIFEAISAGVSIKDTVREVGCSKRTVKVYRNAWLEMGGKVDPCPCGKAAAHGGWCTYRFERSPARQAVLAAMWERQVQRKTAGGAGAPAGDILDLMHLPTPGRH